MATAQAPNLVKVVDVLLFDEFINGWLRELLLCLHWLVAGNASIGWSHGRASQVAWDIVMDDLREETP